MREAKNNLSTRIKKQEKKLMGKDRKRKGKIVATIPNVSLHFSMGTGESWCVSPHISTKHASECAVLVVPSPPMPALHLTGPTARSVSVQCATTPRTSGSPF